MPVRVEAMHRNKLGQMAGGSQHSSHMIRGNRIERSSLGEVIQKAGEAYNNPFSQMNDTSMADQNEGTTNASFE